MNTYQAYFNGKQHTLQAVSLSAAMDAARTYFKPSKAKRYLVSVVLIETASGKVDLQSSNADFG